MSQPSSNGVRGRSIEAHSPKSAVNLVSDLSFAGCFVYLFASMIVCKCVLVCSPLTHNSPLVAAKKEIFLTL